MKTEKDKVKKRIWEKPKICSISLKNTHSGIGEFAPPEDATYRS